MRLFDYRESDGQPTESHYGSITPISVRETPSPALSTEAFVSDTEISTLPQIQEALQQTQSLIQTKSALPGFEGNAEHVEKARKSIDAFILDRLKENRRAPTEAVVLRLFSAALSTQRAGNCYEFSLHCYSLLKKHGISAEVFRIEGGNHVFLVVDRNPSTHIQAYDQWNPEALVVDPFFNQIYPASDIHGRLQSCKYDTESNTVDYIPFNPAVHTLDNQVLTYLIEDWHTVLSQYRNENSGLTGSI